MKFLFATITILLLSFNISAAAPSFTEVDGYVTIIHDLEIEGSLFDVTFHRVISFNDLYGANDESFVTQPYFWGDRMAAYYAALAIRDVLGQDKKTSRRWYTGDGTNSGWTASDTFLVPYQTVPTQSGNINAMGDPYYPLNSDGILDFAGVYAINKTSVSENFTYATFQDLNAVPVPSAISLLAFGLLSLIGIGRFANKKSIK